MFSPDFVLENDFLEYEWLFLDRFGPIKRYCAKDLILSLFDDRSRFCYYILKGTVAYTCRHPNGEEKLSTIRSKGTIFPLYFSFKNTNLDSFLEVTAMTDVELLSIPKEQLRALMEEIPAIAFAMIDAYAKYATVLNYDIASHVFDSIKVRICSFLYLTCFRSNQSPTSDEQKPVVSFTHEEIGHATGVTRANVSRVLSDLRAENIITTERHCIRILDRNKLFQLSSSIVSLAGNDEIQG